MSAARMKTTGEEFRVQCTKRCKFIIYRNARFSSKRIFGWISAGTGRGSLVKKLWGVRKALQTPQLINHRFAFSFLLEPQYLAQTWFVKIDHDLPVDFKGGCGTVAVRPCLHLFSGSGGSGYIHLGIRQVVFCQPGACVFAIGAPPGAVHHDPTVRKLYRFGLWFLKPVSHLEVYLADSAAQNFIGRLIINVVHIHVTDDALLIDDKNGALTLAIIAQYAV
jgi:hypothetical protein